MGENIGVGGSRTHAGFSSDVCWNALVMQEGCQTFTGCHLCVVDKVTNTDFVLKKIVQTLEVDGHPLGSSVAI